MRAKKANSFCEWVVGTNYVSRRKVSSRRTVANLTWQTDDEIDTDTISLSVPRGHRQAEVSRIKKKDKNKNKQVHFAGPSQDTKEVSEGASTDQSGDDTEEAVHSDCPCGKCISARKKLQKRKHGNDALESEGSESDADIHAKHRRKKGKERALKAKAAKNKEAEKNPKANTTREKNKIKHQEKPKDISVSESDTAVDFTTSEDEGKRNTKVNDNIKKGKGGTKKHSQESKDSSKNGEDTDEEPSKAKGSDKGRKQDESSKDDPKARQKKNKEGDSRKTDKNPRGVKADKPVANKEKVSKPKRFPQPPPRRPDLLMPVNAQVLQVEHAVESADDPHPNAFYDAEHGIMRVYHGGAYGNPYGALYPKRWSQNVPLGVPHPSQNPWMYGFAPASHAPAPPLTGFPPTTTAKGPGPGNPWFQGQYTMQVPGPVTPMPKVHGAPYNESPSLRAAAKRENNVGPCPPPNSLAGSNILKEPRDIQGAQGSKNEAANRNTDVAADQANNFWSPQDSKKLEEALNNARKSNSKAGSKASSKKNDDGWGNSGAASWGGNGWGADGNNQNNTIYWGGNANQGFNVGCGDIWGASNDNAGNQQRDVFNGNQNNTRSNDSKDGNKVDDMKNNNENNNTIGVDGWIEPTKGSPSNKPPSTGGNVGPKATEIANNNNDKSPRSNHSNGFMPGAWPPAGGNVFGDSGQGSNPRTQNSPSQVPPTPAGNGTGWGNVNAANETGGFWNTDQGKADQKMTQMPPQTTIW